MEYTKIVATLYLIKQLYFIQWLTANVSRMTMFGRPGGMAIQTRSRIEWSWTGQ